MPGKKRKKTGAVKKPVTDLLPVMLDRALARHEDFIVTCETDPDNGSGTIHILSGRFISSCMLRKLLGQAEAQQDEGSLLVSRRWV